MRNQIRVMLLIVIFSVASVVSVHTFRKMEVANISYSDSTSEIIRIDPVVNPLDVGDRWADILAFGQDDEMALVGSGTIFVSADSGLNWTRLVQGRVEAYITYDGGTTFEEDSNDSFSEIIESKKLCSVDSAQIVTKSKRLFISSTCEHSAQLWSVPLVGSGTWFVWYFLPIDESGQGLGPDAPFKTVGNNVLIRGLNPSGAIILTTVDDGKTWTPFWTKGLFEHGVRDFSFINGYGWILKGDGSIICTEDGGSTWEQLARLPEPESLSSIAFLDRSNGFIVGKRGVIIATKDGGRTWKKLIHTWDIDFSEVIADGQIAWVSGNHDTVIGVEKSGERIVQGTLGKGFSILSRISARGRSAYFANRDKVYEFVFPLDH